MYGPLIPQNDQLGRKMAKRETGKIGTVMKVRITQEIFCEI